MAFTRSLIPSFNPWSGFRDFHDFPSRLSDQFFGMNLLDEDLARPSLLQNYYARPRRHHLARHAGTSEIKSDDKKFQITLDVSHFKPEEISVKTVDNSVVIHGKHEEQRDEHGFISREFTRRYMLPDNVLPETVASTLTNEGFLMVEAPKKAIEAPKPNERVVPINMSPSAAAVHEEKKHAVEDTK